MTRLHAAHLDALRLCLERLHAYDCDARQFAGGGEVPTVRIGCPSAALLDHLDARQLPIGVAFGMRYATVDGCAVMWRARDDLRVSEVQHIEAA